MQNEQTQTHVAKFKVTGGNASPQGTGSITLTLSREATGYEMKLPDETLLELGEIDSLDRVELKHGWRDPMAWLKTGAISVASIFGGIILVDIIKELQPVAEALTALEEAMELGDDEAISNATLSLAEAEAGVSDGADASPEAAVISLAAISGPAAYGGVVLSRRTIAMEITLKNSRYLNVELPEYMGAFLQGAYRANSLILNARESAAATNGAAANDHADEGATAADDT